MKQRILSMLIALAMVVGLIPATVPGALAADADTVDINLMLKAVDTRGGAIEGTLDVLLNGDAWVGTSAENYSTTFSAFVGENVLSGWDYCPDGYVKPTEDITFTVDAEGNVTLTSDNATLEKEGDMHYIVVTLRRHGEGILYFKPNSGWLGDGARFAAYVFSGAEGEWLDLTELGTDPGYYTVTVPDGYDFIIFCRMNGGTATNSWDNKWNQTADLTIPTDGANCYVYPDNAWDGGNGTWETFTPTLPPVAWCDTDEDGTVDEDETTYTTLYEALNAGGTVKLYDDYDATDEGDIVIGHEEDGELVVVTLDLNGKRITSSTGYLLDIYHADVTVVDSSTSGEGGIANDHGDTFYLNSETSGLTVNGGTVVGEVCAWSGELILSGGSLEYVTVAGVTVQLGEDAAVTRWNFVEYGSYFNVDPTDLPGFDAGKYNARKDEEAGLWEVCLNDATITGASIDVGKDLTLNFYVTIHTDELMDRADDFAMRFTMNGKTTTVTAHTVQDWEYGFAFRGIAPQQMTEAIKAEFLVGDEVIAYVSDYSIRRNADTLAEDYSGNEALLQLLADMLAYGAAAQKYTGYNVDEPADADWDWASVSDALPEASDTVMSVTDAEGVTPGEVAFEAVNVWFDNVNKIGVKLSGYTADTKLVVSVDGGEETTYDHLTSDVFWTDGIYAVDFDDVYTFELYEGDTLLQTLTYSVSSYVYSVMEQTKEDGQTLTELAELARALYRYGVSAKAYKESMGGSDWPPPDEAVELTDENVTPYTDGENTATYDTGNGWRGVWNDNMYRYFTLTLQAGDTVYYELSASSNYIALEDVDSGDCYMDFTENGNLFMQGAITAETDGTYTFVVNHDWLARVWVVAASAEEDLVGERGPLFSDSPVEEADELLPSYSWMSDGEDTLDVTIDENGYAAFFSAFAARLPEGLTAYVVTGIDDPYVLWQAIEGDVIPAETPVILAGESGIYTMTVVVEAVSPVEDNLLVVSDEAFTPENTDTLTYVPAVLEGELRARIADVTLPAYHPYFVMDNNL